MVNILPQYMQTVLAKDVAAVQEWPNLGITKNNNNNNKNKKQQQQPINIWLQDNAAPHNARATIQ